MSCVIIDKLSFSLNLSENYLITSIFRALGKYQKSIGKAAYILPDRFTAGGTVFIPYLFGDDELAALFHEIDCYQYPRDPFRPLLLRTYFRMTYTCGLRPNEGRNLRRNEVDLNSGEVRFLYKGIIINHNKNRANLH